MTLQTTPIVLGGKTTRISELAEVASFKLVNENREDLLIGFLKEPDCTSSINKTNLAEIDNDDFDELVINRPTCQRLCEAAVEVAEDKQLEFNEARCVVSCVEKEGYQECLGQATSPLPLTSLDQCQNAL